MRGELLESIAPLPGTALVEMIGERLRVIAADRPGLLSAIVGLLTLHGQSIRSAQVWSSEQGAAVDEFEIEPVFDKELDAERFADDLERGARRTPRARRADRGARRMYLPKARRPTLPSHGSTVPTTMRRSARRSSRCGPATRSGFSTG